MRIGIGLIPPAILAADRSEGCASAPLGCVRDGLGDVAARMLPAAVVLLAGVIAWYTVRGRLSSRALRDRVMLRLVPTEAFEVDVEQIRKVVVGWHKARPAVLRRLAPRRAFPIRIKIHCVEGGLVVYDLQAPRHMETTVRELGYPGVQIGVADDHREGGRSGGGKSLTARVELVPARDDIHPLKEVPLRPDPLTQLYRALASVADDEMAEIAIDLLPVTPAQATRRRRALMRAERRGRGPLGRSNGVPWWQILLRAERAQRRPSSAAPRGGLSLLEERAAGRGVAGKLLAGDPLFAMQVLICARSGTDGRATALVNAVTAAFAQFNGAQNHLRAAGLNLGVAHLGSDVPGWRAWFDHRLDRGAFAPRYRRRRGGPWVSVSEIAGLLKPPTVHCPADNALRLPAIPAPPKDLPLYEGQPEVIPLGWVHTADGAVPAGVPREDTLFTLAVGRAGAGKTEQEIGRFLALAYSGCGVAYLDFHDAAQRIRPYLVDQADRVIDLDLGRARGRDGEQIAWNPLDMTGRTAADIERRVDAVVDAVAATMHWDQRNNRALTLLTMATQALCRLGLKLPPDAQPTLFQIATILSDQGWRRLTLAHLDAVTRDFFEQRFPLLEREVTPVTNLIDRLRRSDVVAALLGAGHGGFNLRAAMDTGKIVLISFGGSGTKERLVASLFSQELFTAALSRIDIPEQQRREFHAFIDEAQVLDHSAHLAEMFEQVRKFKLRLHVACQQPTRLSAETRTALLNNRSHLIAGTVETGAARLLTREFADQVPPAAIAALDRYAGICSVTLHGKISPPFLVRGYSVEELHAAHHNSAGVGSLDRAAGPLRRPVAQTLAALDSLDDRIAAHLAAHATQPDREAKEVAGGEPRSTRD